MRFVAVALSAMPLFVGGAPTATVNVPGIGDIVSNKLDGGITESLGVRYAAAPVDANRFRTPQPMETSGSDKINATSWGSACLQPDSKMSDPGQLSEDCLFLNIWAPPRPEDGTLLPVFFWIHGGGFIFGSGNLYNATSYAQRGVVGVSINYRLGAFGFLENEEIARESPDAPGNGAMNGLLDQVAALQWVHEHISAFGGDPKQVTIGGQSSGSLSTCAHLHLPASVGLFHRAILQSGSCTAGSPWGAWDATKHREASELLMLGVGASTLGGLREVDAQAILNSSQYMGCGPAPDGFNFKENPSELDVASKNVDVLVGSNTMDTLNAPPYNGSVPIFPDAPTPTGAYKLLVTSYFGDDVLGFYPPPPEGAAEQEAWNALYRINSDVCNTCPKLWEAAKFIASGSNVYMYEFGFYSKGPLRGLACHGCELVDTFNDPLLGLEMVQWAFDPSLAADLQSYWSAFMKGGVPADESVWPRYNSQALDHEGSFLNISTGADGRPVVGIGRAAASYPGCDFFKTFIETGDRYSTYKNFCDSPVPLLPHAHASDVHV